MLFTTDQQTMEDLNIFGRHSAASIYSMFNRTFTRGGAALLEEMFRYPLSDAVAINKRSRMIRYFAANPGFPFNNELFDIAEQYLNNTDERTKLSNEKNSIVNTLSNLVAHDPAHKFINIGVAALVTIIDKLRQLLRTLDNDEEVFYQEKESINAVLTEPALTALPTAKTKLSYVAIAELDIVFRFKNREAVIKLLRHIYHIDVYISVARVATEKGFVFPKALAQGEYSLTIKDFYHPQLPGSVPNSIHLAPINNVVFLTGANMAGKSTFMKSLGTAIYMAHLGFPVAATFMEFGVLGGIYTTINLPDNLGTGTSHFYAEVLRVKKIAKELALGKNLFVIVDELFRGTNVKDAYEATIAITAGFAKKRNSMFVISTHIIEAAPVLQSQCENISFCYMPTLMDNNKPIYTYKVKEGITDDRHGMIIINNEGIIDLLLKGKGQTA